MPLALRRLVFGLFWFGVFWVALIVIGGGIAGAMAGAKSAPPGGNFEQGYESGQRAGSAAGIQFRQRHGTWVCAGAAVLAAAGSVTGVLPGTRRR